MKTCETNHKWISITNVNDNVTMWNDSHMIISYKCKWECKVVKISQV